MNHDLSYFVDSVARRYRNVQWAWILTICWVVFAAAWIVGSMTDDFSEWLSWQRGLLGLSVLPATVLGTWLLSKRSYRDPRWVASKIEATFPALQERLITAIQLKQVDGFFERSLIEDTVRHARAHNWSKAIPACRVWLAWICQWLSLGLACFVLTRVWNEANSPANSSVPALSSDALLVSPSVEPGDIECERGTDVIVSARFPGKVPTEAWLETSSELSKPIRESMTRNLKDPVYSSYLRNVQSDQVYRIDFLEGTTREYKITTFEYPVLVRSDATIESPAYANLDRKTVENTRRVTVVDGATLTWNCYVNKPLSTAELIDESGTVTPLLPVDHDPLCYRASFVMTESMRWKVRLMDDQQRASKFLEELSAKVLPNREPEIKLARASDSRVSPLQEFQIRATVQDDFEIQKSGVVIAIGQEEPREVDVEVLRQKPGKVDVSYLVDLESMKAQPDQLVNYYFWSEDLDSSGQLRRVEGEMFFAEVRPFEEIFREGPAKSEQEQQQQQQQPSQGEQQAEELSELQKKIMTATWNVIRREKQPTVGPNFSKDVQTLADSQEQALEKTEELEKSLKDEQSLEYLEQVRDAMTSAVQELQGASAAQDVAQLRQAFRYERNANEMLLKLRAREHQIVKSQSSQSKSSQSSSQQDRQQQLEQLQLQDDENRYETEAQAESSEPSAQRETRQVMNRLDELARRQKDINEQLKNLETELQEAKSEEKKKEIEERLEKLRDNQEDLLRDTDELLERMDEPENRQAMQEAREQTESSRNELQKSTQSLSQGETSQALSAGTRAERQLEETREQLRKESSDQFDQTMRQMLDQAEKLEKQQQKLLEEISPKKPPSAPDPDGSEAPAMGSNDDQASPLRPESDQPTGDARKANWQNQKRDMNELLEKMRETVAEAESSEPLLAEQLYDTFRETKQNGIEQRMDQIPILIERGFQEPASQIANEVRQGVQDLKEGIQEAAKGVLGSEQESLKRAVSELQQAQRQLNSEIENKEAKEATEATEGNTAEATASKSQQPGLQPTESANPQAQQSGESGSASDPITGDAYAAWSDSLRDVEELVRDQSVRAEAARIREAVRSMRVEYKRHAKEPEWPLVRELVANPLAKLTEKVQEELLRLSAERNALVPVDRDPVPSLYQQRLDRYYENLGSGKNSQQQGSK